MITFFFHQDFGELISKVANDNFMFPDQVASASSFLSRTTNTVYKYDLFCSFTAVTIWIVFQWPWMTRAVKDFSNIVIITWIAFEVFAEICLEIHRCCSNSKYIFPHVCVDRSFNNAVPYPAYL